MNEPQRATPEKTLLRKKRLPSWLPAIVFAAVYLLANIYFLFSAECEWDYVLLALWAGVSVMLYLLIWRVERYVARVERYIKQRHGHRKANKQG